MKIYAFYGFKEFVIALGYKGNVIKDYFLNYRYRERSLTVNLSDGNVSIHEEYNNSEDWIVHLLNTGETTQTGGRIKLAAEFIGHEPFMMTYGDGVSNVNIPNLLNFHRQQGKLATLTAVRPPARFGQMLIEQGIVNRFEEKPLLGTEWVSGGFFVLEPEAIDYIPDYRTIWEREPLEKLVRDQKLAAYQHHEFWHCMDTFRDVNILNQIWETGNIPWKVWA